MSKRQEQMQHARSKLEQMWSSWAYLPDMLRDSDVRPYQSFCDEYRLCNAMPAMQGAASVMHVRPVTHWTTPGGNPALWKVWIMWRAETAPWLGGFTTTTFPAIRAGAILETARLTG